MQRLMRWIHLLLLVCPLLGGCVSRPEPVSHPTLIGSFAEPDSMEPLIAEEAYIDDEDFYIRYRLAEQTLYTQGSWSDRISIVEPSAVDSPPPYIVPTARPTAERWKGFSEDAHPVRLLDERSWQEFRERFLGRFLSSTPQSGIVIHFNADDYFLYANENGTFQSVVIDQMPAGYQVTDELAFEELLDLGAPVLEDYLNEIGVTERRVAFNTGDVGDYSLPFLYVNRDLPIAVFVRLQPYSHAHVAGTPATPLLQTAGHVVESHSTNLLARPLSSIYKLLFITSDTLAQTVKPEYLVSLEQDPIPPISDSAPMDLDRWEDELTRITGRTPSLGTVAHLIDGEEFFTRFITEVSSAQSSISLRIYIFDNDDYALRIADLLRRRSNEGIEVKVLLDGLGTIISTAEKQETLPAGFCWSCIGT